MNAKQAYITADISELWAGYYAHLIDDNGEKSVPCRTKEDAQEIVDKFFAGEILTDDTDRV
jgi:hypothetical protein